LDATRAKLAALARMMRPKVFEDSLGGRDVPEVVAGAIYANVDED
jgi:hypothetical protein